MREEPKGAAAMVPNALLSSLKSGMAPARPVGEQAWLCFNHRVSAGGDVASPGLHSLQSMRGSGTTRWSWTARCKAQECCFTSEMDG